MCWRSKEEEVSICLLVPRLSVQGDDGTGIPPRTTGVKGCQFQELAQQDRHLTRMDRAVADTRWQVGCVFDGMVRVNL